MKRGGECVAQILTGSFSMNTRSQKRTSTRSRVSYLVAGAQHKTRIPYALGYLDNHRHHLLSQATEGF